METSLPPSDSLVSTPDSQVGHTPRAIPSMQEKVNLARALLIEKANKHTTVHPLSYNQQALWFLYYTTPDSVAYNEGIAVRIPQAIRPDALQRAAQKLVNRHPALRTTYQAQDGVPMQQIHGYQAANVTVRDAHTDTETDLVAQVKQDHYMPFNLTTGPVCRVFLYQAGPADQVLLLSVHHIACDGSSMTILLSELLLFYQEEATGQKADLPTLTSRYVDFVDAQHNQLADEAGEALRQYWLTQLADNLPLLDLPLDKPRPRIHSDRGGTHTLHLDAALTRSLKALSKTEGNTLFVTLLSAFQLLLHRHTGQDDLVVGTPTMTRSHADFEQVVGYFVNPVAIRSSTRDTTSGAAFLARTKQTVLGAIEHQDYPFPLLVDQLGLSGDLSQTPVFQAFFYLQTAGQYADYTDLLVGTAGSVLDMHGIPLAYFPFESKEGRFDISLEVVEHADTLTGIFRYNADIFHDDTIGRLAGQYQTLLQSLVANPRLPVAQLDLLTRHEQAQLLALGRGPVVSPPPHETFALLFEAQVRRSPQATALEHEGVRFTYEQLNAQANQLAHYLRDHHALQPNDLVGLHTDRSPWMVIGMLSVFKAGGAFFPIHPDLPPPRIDNLLTQTRARLVLTDRAPVGESAAHWLGLATDWATIAQGPTHNPMPVNTPADLAYVIFTSGSTGQPKGAMIEHQGMINHLHAKINDLGLHPGSVVAQNASQSFDISVWQTLVSLVCGGKTIIYGQDVVLDMDAFLHRTSHDGVTVLEVVPSYLATLLDKLADHHNPAQYAQLEHLLVTGETLPKHLIARWFAQFPGIPMVNAYGPTEASDDITHHRLDHAPDGDDVPIGRTIQNLSIYILDGQQRLCPLGVKGELCVAGVGVGQGYLGDQAKTDAVFGPDPFVPGQRLYHTGDVARMLPDGTLLFYGRRDFQVKVRGHRIELGEIEQTLARIPGIRNAVVICQPGPDGDGHLTGWVVTEPRSGLTAATIRDMAQGQLPGYMVPAELYIRSSLPLTPNGKLDRNALARLSTPDAPTAGYVPPGNHTQLQLVSIWQNLLNRPKIGITDRFFEVGGNSLKAIRLQASIQKQLHVSLSLKDLFVNTTINTLAPLIQAAAGETVGRIEPVAEADVYPVSSAQRRLWILDQLAGVGATYNMPGAFWLTGPLNREAFGRAFRAIMDRHESLRTVFSVDNGEPVQRVLPADASPFELTYGRHDGTDAQLTHQIIDEAQRCFSLEKGPLLRASLTETSADRYLFLVTIHHISCDGWSLEVLVRELMLHYHAYARGESPLLAPLRIQQKDYAAWQHGQLSPDNAACQQGRAYWLGQFADDVPSLHLPTDFPRPAVKTYRGSSVVRALDAATLETLRGMASRHGTSLFTTLLTSVLVLLNRYTGQTDLVVGTTVAGRDHPDLEDQIGLFVNTLALRVPLLETNSFAQCTEAVKRVWLGAIEHQHYPFDQLIQALPLTRDPSRSPLFDVLVELISADINAESALFLEGVTIERCAPQYTTAKYDLSFRFLEEGTSITLQLEYNQDLYAPWRMKAMLAHYGTLLAAIAADENRPVANLSLLPATEQHTLLQVFNPPVVPGPPPTLFLTRFREQVAKNPNAVALEIEDKSLTYNALDDLSDRLAYHLREAYGVLPGQRVALMLERSERTVIGLLGIMKAGGAFLPIDVAYPRDRIAYLLADADSQLLLTDSHHLFDLPEAYEQAVFALDIQLAQLAAVPQPLVLANDPGALAYVIYTSGSTGQPKGVMIEQGNLANYLNWANAYYFGGDSGYHTALFSSLSFDFTLTSILTTLLRGDTLYICPNQEIDGLLGDLLRHPRINWLKLTPAHINALAFLAVPNERLALVIVGGEELTGKQVGVLRSINSNLLIYNEYGPTETTVGCTVKCIAPADDPAPITIGRPIANTHIHIVDRHLNLLPVGVPGEIAIAGASVGRGYLNAPDLSATRFISSWPQETFGGRLYRSGDVGCWLPNGEIMYLGRKDNQVKIRGYRVETGEIEQVLLTYPAVRQVVVKVWQPAGQSPVLVAYVGSADGVPDADLRAFLATRLPAYMIPTYVVQLDMFPLTGNGKVDRSALPPPDAQALSQTASYVPPRHAVDEALITIWERVLGRSPIGIGDNFFAIGGHSLRAIQLVASVANELNVRVELRDIFAQPTIEAMGDLVRAAKVLPVMGISPAPVQADYPVSFAQRRLWINQQLDSGLTAFNISKAYVVTGALDPAAFVAALTDLMQQHESLRTTFSTVAGEPRQVIHPFDAQALPLTQLTLSHAEDAWAEAMTLCQAQAGAVFDLASGPLWRVYLLRLPTDQWVVQFCIHHIICDDWSAERFLAQFSERYRHHRLGTGVAQLPPAIQYKDYAVWQRQEQLEHRFDAHRVYWTEVLAGVLPVLDLPTDWPRPARKTYQGSTRRLVLDAALCQGLDRLGAQAGASTFMTFLATVKALLYRYTGQADLVVGTPVADREQADLADQIGFYTNTIALRTQVQPGERFGTLLEQVKSCTIDAYAHQSYPLDQLVDDLDLQHDPSRSPLFDVVVLLQYQNAEPLWSHPTDGVHATDLPVEQTTSLVDLRFIFNQTDHGWDLELDYDTSLFSAPRIDRLLGHYQHLVANLLHQPDAPLDRLNVLPDEERDWLMGLNPAHTPLPDGLTMTRLLATQVEKTPYHPALECNGRVVSYQQLADQSDRLAEHLRHEMGLAVGQCVALMAEKSERMVIAFWAILKAGGVYLPIDPALPAARKQYMLTDAAVGVLLTDSDHLFDLDGYEGGIFALDVQLDGLPESTRPAYTCQPTDAAYLIYTSGSTGQPKGVLVEHGSNVNMALSQIDSFGVEAGDRVWLFAPLSFDASISEICMALYCGATLVLPAGRNELDTLTDTLRAARITVVTLPPALLQVMDVDQLGFLHVLISAGEAAPGTLARASRVVARCFNAYGPTEYGVCASIYRVAPTDEAISNIPIGRAIANTQLLVLDAHHQLLPPGLPGELYLAGVGLARGYWQRPDLTADRFVAHPFAPGQRLYRTGDLARWRADGQLEYLGRLDGQVKIRGMRTELGEIEHALRQHPAVEQAVVLLHGQELRAYLVAEESLSLAALRQELAASLPAYMVPTRYERLAQLPLTSSGKVDRAALLALEGGAFSEAADVRYEAPATELEAQLVAIWQGVLGRERVGVSDNFFELGGHSLKAIQVIARLYQQAGISLELRAVFAHPTIRSLAAVLATTGADSVSEAAGYQAIARQPVSGHYPLSHAQQRLWILDQLHADDAMARAAYNVPSALWLGGVLNVAALEVALLGLLARHDSLRTVFDLQEGEARQRVVDLASLDLALACQDLRQEADPLAQAQALAQVQAGVPFQLGVAPLLRAGVWQVADEQYLFLITIHHIICDGWSMEVLVGELAQFYNAALRGQASPLPPLPIQYGDYALWQQAGGAAVLAGHGSYWREQLGGSLPVLELPTDFPRPAIKTYRADRVVIFLESDLRDGLSMLANDHGSSLFTVLLAAVQTLLYRYTGQTDLIVGIPVAGRGNLGLDEQVGFFVNMLPIRTRLEGHDGFSALLTHVTRTVLDAYAHELYPFDRMVDELDPRREAGRSPIFDVSVEFVMPDQELTKSIELDHLRVRPYEVAFVQSKYDITFTFMPTDGGISLELAYAADLFTADRMTQLAGLFATLVRSVVAQPTAPISRLDWLTVNDIHFLAEAVSDAATAYEADATIHGLFERQATQTPAAVAVQYGHRQLTYAQLNAQANQLAYHLRTTYQIQPDDLIGVLMEPSERRVVALLAILKAGAAYVPIDPNYPADRIRYTLADATAKVLLTDTGDPLVTSELTGVEQLALANWDSLEANPTDNLPPLSGPHNLVYVIYTSGSTGRPKGVMLEHTSVVNRIEWMWKQYGFGPDDVILQKTSYGFDVSVWEFFMPLCYGARLVVCDTAVAHTPALLLDCIAEYGVSTIHFVPTMFAQFLDGIRDEDRAKLASLHRVFASGEALLPDMVRLNAQRTGVPLYNLYGPTEAAVDVTHYTTQLADSECRNIPIGRAIANTQLLVLDAHHQLLPPGLPGELYLAGVGLARGYWQRPDLTADRFVAHPFAPGQRLYRTGDLARWRADGQLEYLGRLDGQVKIRGMRTELGEIEHALRQHPAVEQAVVLLHGQELRAYLVAEESLSLAALRQELAASLPAYMVPTRYERLAQLPLTSSGKVDRAALLALGGGAFSEAADLRYEAPATELEAQLVAIWQGVLGRERVGVSDNFFELGGHSLKAIQVIARLYQQAGISLELRAVFAHPTIRSLAAVLATTVGKATDYQAIARQSVPTHYPLSHAQQRLWILDQLHADDAAARAAYNVPSALLVQGPLNVPALAEALQGLLNRHESLRTVFELHQGQARQRVLPVEDLTRPLHYEDLREMAQPLAEAQARGQRQASEPFDLGEGPLLRAAVWQVGEAAHMVGLTLHHIICDGWSLEVLVGELAQFYNAALRGQASPLPPLPIQYGDYALWQQAGGAAVLAGHGSYWREQLGGTLPVLELPTDFPRPAIKTYASHALDFTLDESLTQAFRQVSTTANTSLFATLFTAVAALLNRYSGQDDIIIGTAVAGRDHHDLHSQIGFYLNTLALRLSFGGPDDFVHLAQQTQQTMLSAFEHQAYPFEQLVDDLHLTRDTSRSPLFDVLVVSQDFGLAHEALPGPATFDGLTTQEFGTDFSANKYDLTFYLGEVAGRITVRIAYNTDLFRPERIQRMFAHFVTLSQQALARPKASIYAHNYLSDREYQDLVVQFNDTQTPYAAHQTLHGLFERQVVQTPLATALQHSDRRLTYAQLNARANQLARYLVASGVAPGNSVGLLTDRSFDMVIGMLAILKAGAAYVPIDPDYPISRQEYILGNASIRCAITNSQPLQAALMAGYGAYKDNHCLLFGGDAQVVDHYADTNPGIETSSRNLAYIIYTSGSTGQPKGVMIEHHSAVNLIEWVNTTYAVGVGDRLLFVTSMCFDLSVYDLFGMLACGGCVVMAGSAQVQHPDVLARLLHDEAITFWDSVPSTMDHLITALEQANGTYVQTTLRLVFMSGDWIPVSLPDRLKICFPNARVVSLGGATEGTVWSNYYPVDAVAPHWRSIPYGKPIANNTFYILDKGLHPVPQGVIGELYIGGVGVARGYQQEEEKTRYAFVADPFATTPGQTMYRTGDLGRMMPDGNMEFLGRKDNQVKVRGYRVELGEIEKVLLTLPGVQQAAVTAFRDAANTNSLAAYVVADRVLSGTELTAWLKQWLPAYMLPASYMQLDAFPLNANGKVDRAAFPPPQQAPPEQACLAPRNELEGVVLTIWQQVLLKEAIGIDDNFFQIGGHSLLATRIVAHIYDQLGVRIGLTSLFTNPTIEGLALEIDAAQWAAVASQNESISLEDNELLI
ncbi:non-ribosomal peptide synthetase [Fibrella aquatilis]|uniref:Amino acid adenylation domain-containing protein n=1 Tax=Fibrella aquatilis TaxID=2817059 RepID=A0A939JW26_9BACT|nr:non-ribosomal peptide synthetase [Fibrella aquatilis]MBO0931462.1 amino acid adenylation domain-containing protein [Fibrella aquatilis]